MLAVNGTIPTWTTVTQSYLSGAAWTLSGNIVGANDYIGTNNAQPLIVRTNSGEKMRILSATSSTGALLFLRGGDMVISGMTVGL